MEDTKIVWHNMSEHFNKEELHYRNNLQLVEENYNSIDIWKKKVSSGRVAYFRRCLRKIPVSGRVLELCAGCCCLGSEVSKLSSVKEIFCLDFSERLLEDIAPKMMNYLNANKKKITRIVGDAYNLQFKDKTFDWVIIDAALHHIDDMDRFLSGVKRVLRDDGHFLAIREPIIPKLRPGSKSAFGKYERSLGLTENIYTKQEWNYFFRKNGFELRFLPFIPEYDYKYKLINRTPLKLLNGSLFAHYLFIAKKQSRSNLN